MTESTSDNKYGIALEVLEELLPERELCGPLFDDALQRLEAKMNWARSEIFEYTRQISKASPAGEIFDVIAELKPVIEADLKEMSLLQQADLMRLKQLDRIDSKLFNAKLGLINSRLTMLNVSIDSCFRLKTDLASMALESFPVMVEDMTTQLLQLRNLWILQGRLLVTAHNILDCSSVLPEILENLPLQSVEQMAEFLVDHADTYIKFLLPFSSLALDALKAWRRRKVSAEEAIALIKLLISTREVIALLESADVRKSLFVNPEIHRDKADQIKSYLRQLVDQAHKRWLENRDSLAVSWQTATDAGAGS